jgi:hypothetical protein
MPGIIPMKLIKCGSSQTRIAQACDRCRSKKIRCDGIRPCCSQCSNVGFECKTSDKLSRRAFPRGYTESLEERVRTLEREVRELKDLLDAKDEQLDMLSKIHSFSPYSPPASNSSGTMRGGARKTESLGSGRSASVDGDEAIAVSEPTRLINVEGRDGMYMGASSGTTFVGMAHGSMACKGRGLYSLDRHIKTTYARSRTIYSGIRDRTVFPGTALRHRNRFCATARRSEASTKAAIGSSSRLLLPRVPSVIPRPSQTYVFVDVREVGGRHHISCLSACS